jgi:predicted metal-dependent enzyme (double-stranded beta helix superfamily)
MRSEANASRGAGLDRLRQFVFSIAELIDAGSDEPEILVAGAPLLRALVSQDDWLPDEYAAPDPARYRQYLLHCDSRERFSIVSFVWGPSQATPIHDHRVWGLIGILRGAERNQSFGRDPSGRWTPVAPPELLPPGTVSTVSPRIGDIHRVSNAHDDRVSISIHVYGANIGAVHRSVYDDAGRTKPFVSGYANRALPNLWEGSSLP